MRVIIIRRWWAVGALVALAGCGVGGAATVPSPSPQIAVSATR